MVKKYLREILFGIIFVLTLLFDYRISLGLLLGVLFSYLQVKLITVRADGILRRRKAGFLVFLSSILSVAAMAIPLLITFLLPDIFSWIGTFIGMIYGKMYLYISAFIGGKK